MHLSLGPKLLLIVVRDPRSAVPRVPSLRSSALPYLVVSVSSFLPVPVLFAMPSAYLHVTVYFLSLLFTLSRNHLLSGYFHKCPTLGHKLLKSMSISFLLSTVPFKESVTNALGMGGNSISPHPSPVPAPVVYPQSGGTEQWRGPPAPASTLEPVKMQIPRSHLRRAEPNK